MGVTITINEEYLNFTEEVLDVKGNGTEEEPYIIDSEVNPPTYFEMYESNDFIKIVGLKLDSLAIFHCSNISIEDCTIESLELIRSSVIKVLNCECTYRLDLKEATECVVEECTLEELKLYNSNNNHFSKNQMRSFSHYSKAPKSNIFTDNILPEKYIEKKIEMQKITLEVSAYTGSFSKTDPSDYELVCESGSGTKNDPYIVKNQEKSHQDVCLGQYRAYIHLINLIKNPKFMCFSYCKHLRIEGCTFQGYELLSCDDFTIQNTTTNTLLIGGGCGTIIIEDSLIGKLKTRNYHQGKIIFKNCTIKKMKKEHQELFEFQGCTIEKISMFSLF